MISGRKSNRKSQSSSTIVKIAVTGIAIGMAVMILSVGIVHGFQNEVRQKVIGFGSHLQISLYNPQNALGAKPMDAEQPFVEKILDISKVSCRIKKGLSISCPAQSFVPLWAIRGHIKKISFLTPFNITL